jgi:hypothetical protein
MEERGPIVSGECKMYELQVNLFLLLWDFVSCFGGLFHSTVMLLHFFIDVAGSPRHQPAMPHACFPTAKILVRDHIPAMRGSTWREESKAAGKIYETVKFLYIYICTVYRHPKEYPVKGIEYFLLYILRFHFS